MKKLKIGRNASIRFVSSFTWFAVLKPAPGMWMDLTIQMFQQLTTPRKQTHFSVHLVSLGALWYRKLIQRFRSLRRNWTEMSN